MPLDSKHIEHPQIQFLHNNNSLNYVRFLSEYTEARKIDPTISRKEFSVICLKRIYDEEKVLNEKKSGKDKIDFEKFEVDEMFIKGYLFNYEIMFFDTHKDFVKVFSPFFNEEKFDVIESAFMDPDTNNTSFPNVIYNKDKIEKSINEYVKESGQLFPKVLKYLDFSLVLDIEGQDEMKAIFFQQYLEKNFTSIERCDKGVIRYINQRLIIDKLGPYTNFLFKYYNDEYLEHLLQDEGNLFFLERMTSMIREKGLYLEHPVVKEVESVKALETNVNKDSILGKFVTAFCDKNKITFDEVFASDLSVASILEKKDFEVNNYNIYLCNKELFIHHEDLNDTFKMVKGDELCYTDGTNNFCVKNVDNESIEQYISHNTDFDFLKCVMRFVDEDDSNYKCEIFTTTGYQSGKSDGVGLKMSHFVEIASRQFDFITTNKEKGVEMNENFNKHFVEVVKQTMSAETSRILEHRRLGFTIDDSSFVERSRLLAERMMSVCESVEVPCEES